MATTTSPSPPPPLARRGCPLTRPYTIRGTQANLPRRNRNRNRPRRYYDHRLPDSVTNTAATSSPLHQPPPRHPYVRHRSNATFAAPASDPSDPTSTPLRPPPPRHHIRCPPTSDTSDPTRRHPSDTSDAAPTPFIRRHSNPATTAAAPTATLYRLAPTCGTYYYTTTTIIIITAIFTIIITVITVIIIIIIIFNYECGKSGVTAT